MNILTESKLEKLTRDIVRTIFNEIKNYSGDDLEVSRMVDDVNITLQIIYDENTNLKLICNTTQENIEVFIFTNKTQFNQKSYEILYERLLNVLRHELEHYTQLQKDNNILPLYDKEHVFEDIDELKKYLLDPNEVDAYVSEIYYASKRQKNTFNDCFKERIKPFIKILLNNYYDKNEIQQLMSTVKSVWFKIAKKKYPLTQVT